MTNESWTRWHAFGLLAIVVAVVLVGLLVPRESRLWAWLITMVLLTIFAAVVGQGITKLWRGVLIDERNRVSLSRLQMLVWTIVVVSGFLIAALSNIAARHTTPLAIVIPSELWALLGISTTSLVGSPLIRSPKKDRTPNGAEWQSTRDRMVDQGMRGDQVDHKGLIVVYKTPEDSRWSDLFRGEETGNAAQVDLAKIQMFYFTVALVLAYAAVLGKMLGAGGVIDRFPPLDSGLVALLGISHAGYLTGKGIPHSQTA